MYVYTFMYIYMRKLGVYVCETCNSEECIEENYDDIFGIWDVSVWESQEKVGRTMFEQ